MKMPRKNRFRILGRRSGQTRVGILVLVSFVLGAGAGFLLRTRPVAESSGLISQVMQKDVPNAPLKVEVDPAVLEGVKRAIPDAGAATVASGTRILRKSALEEFQQAVQELKARQQQAEQELLQARDKLPPAEQRLAAKKLLELKAKGFERLQQIAANGQARVEAFEYLKREAE